MNKSIRRYLCLGLGAAATFAILLTSKGLLARFSHTDLR